MTGNELVEAILAMPEEERAKDVMLRSKHNTCIFPVNKVRKSVETMAYSDGGVLIHGTNQRRPAETHYMERQLIGENKYASIPECYLTDTRPEGHFLIISDEQ